jgi:hypothetical protein
LGLHSTIVLPSAWEAFHSAGFARAPEGAFDIVNAPASLFHGPVFHGAADLSVVWHTGPFFLFLGDAARNESARNAYQWYAAQP